MRRAKIEQLRRPTTAAHTGTRAALHRIMQRLPVTSIASAVVIPAAAPLALLPVPSPAPRRAPHRLPARDPPPAGEAAPAERDLGPRAGRRRWRVVRRLAAAVARRH